jgi:hypothetical protein
MKTSYTAAAAAVLLSLGASAALAAPTSVPLQTGVINDINQLDPTLVVPVLSDNDLGVLKSALDDTQNSDQDKRMFIRNYLHSS